MVRRALVTVFASLLAATALASAGHAASRELWPGVTYEPGVQFTSRGPVAINVLRGPRPGGLTTLEPVLSNDTVVGRETLTAMQRRLASTATAAGVNGDYFTLATGKPSGVLMRDAQLVSPPNAGRASAGITTDGRLDIRRVGFAGDVARVGRQPAAECAQRPAVRGGRGPAHRRVRTERPGAQGERRRRPLRLPRRHPRRRSRRPGGRGAQRRECDRDPARRSRAARTRRGRRRRSRPRHPSVRR